jgi:hypothetical protein
MTRKCQVRFGGGPTEKARQRDLAGGLPDLIDDGIRAKIQQIQDRYRAPNGELPRAIT